MSCKKSIARAKQNFGRQKVVFFEKNNRLENFLVYNMRFEEGGSSGPRLYSGEASFYTPELII